MAMLLVAVFVAIVGAPLVSQVTSVVGASPTPSSGASTVTLHIPPSASPNAYGPISPSWLGYGIEGAYFPHYVGVQSGANEVTRNLLDTISNRTGAATIVRIGGTSLDHSKFNATQKQAAVQGTKVAGQLRGLTLGPSFFELFNQLPNVRITLQVPLAPNNLSWAVYFAQQSLAHIGSRLYAIEIGNEPSAYPGRDRPKTWSLPNYVQQWKQYANSLDRNVKLPSGPIYQGLTFGWGLPVQGTPWTVQNAYADGYFNGTRIKTVTRHFYESRDDTNIGATLLNHTFTVAETRPFSSDIDFLKSKEPSVPFVLGEAGSSSGGGTKNKADNLPYSNGLGAAVWNVDWMLYAMSIGIDAVSMQQGSAWTFSNWNPEAAFGLHTPKVYSSYMGQVAVADFIGASKAGLHVLALSTSDPHVTAYAGYRNSIAQQFMVTNLQVWDGTGARPFTEVEVPAPAHASRATTRRLTGSSTGALDNVTWAGETWTWSSSGRPIQRFKPNETTPLVNDKAKIMISASEAVIIQFD